MRSMPLWIATCLLALPASPVHSANQPKADGPPNIVVIFIDDLGYADIGPFGATKQKTPHLDRMAREGLKLTSFYGAPVCSVSRAQLLTGCYGARVSVPGVFFPAGRQGLHPAEVTIAERLQERGYTTACVGKWHLGDQPAFLPVRQGFDRNFGIPYSNDMQKRATETGQRVVPLLRDNAVAELLTDEAQTRLVERYTTEAVSFIRDNQAKPFFLYLAHNAVHTPIHPGKAFAGKSANGRFGDWVEETDWSVGRVLDALRDTGLDRRTLVIFTSDNGPWLTKGADGGSAGPLRGGKGGTFEGGVRVPTLAWWPGKVAPGTVCDAVAGTIDLLPTAVSLAGGVLPAQPRIDGRDMSALLLGKTKESPREAHYYFAGYALQAVRQGPWKLAITAQAEGMGRPAAPDANASQPRLYHLDQEIGERTNLAEKNPEVVSRLRRLATTMSAEIGGEHPTHRRPPGEVAQASMLYPSSEAAPPGGNPSRLDTLKPGEALVGPASPRIAGKAFALACTVETSQRDAVILAQGGAVLGYALHLRAGRVVFAVRTDSVTVTEVVAPEVAGPLVIEAALGGDGTLSLVVNGKPAVTARGPGLINSQPQEGLSLGRDEDRPVTRYTATEPFRGTIRALSLKVAKP